LDAWKTGYFTAAFSNESQEAQMAVTLKIIEGEPSTYPQVTEPLPASDSQLEKVVTNAWQRIEAYIAHRWNSRSIVYVAEGPGEWFPTLSPTTISTFEVWRDNQWQVVTLDPTPLGGYILARETYQLTGIVGSTDEPPRAVKNAVFRLVEYFINIDETPRAQRVASTYKTDQEPYFQPAQNFHSLRSVEYERSNPNWIARALQYSGAADLLRPYRKLGGS
jgi:hypothetical protein